MISKGIAVLARDLIEVGIALTSIHDLDDLLEMIVTEARRFANCDAASLYIAEKDFLQFALTQNQTLIDRLGEEATKKLFKPFPLPISSGSVAGYVAQTGERLLIDNAYNLPPDAPFVIDRTFDQRNDYKTGSMLVLPMRARDEKVVGVLQLINCLDDKGDVVPFGQDITDVVEALASQAAIAIRNAQLTSELRQSHFNSIVRLATAAEYRDGDTADHIRRVSYYCAVIARQLGWNKEDQELIRYASAMHDVGKIAIPDSVLLKKGSLDAQERALIEQHTTLGGRILGDPDSDVLSMARIMALSHHERWGGNGYPQGLVGEKIPACGRICAVADVFDALMSERRYKHALPLDEVLAILRRDSGTMFEPAAVDAFMTVLDEIMAIRRTYSGGPDEEPPSLTEGQ